MVDHVTSQVCSGIDSAVTDHKVDAVLCVAGGWAGGNAASPGKKKCLSRITLFMFPVQIW